MFRSILCATDFSPNGTRALELAARWAEAQCATLDILHVVPPLRGPVPSAGLLEELHASMQNDAEGKVDALAAQLAPRVRAKGHVAMGVPRDTIALAAKELGSELVVVGTGGEHAVARALLGGVSDRLVRTSEAAVLLVPDGAAVALPRVIVAPTDLSDASKDAVERALDLAHALSATVEVVHAYQIPMLLARDAPIVRDLALTLRSGVRALHDLGSRANLHVMEASPARAITDVVTSTAADLVVMAARGHDAPTPLLGGVTDRVLRTCNVPVLVFRKPRRAN